MDDRHNAILTAQRWLAARPRILDTETPGLGPAADPT
jgi:hypothetical protein